MRARCAKIHNQASKHDARLYRRSLLKRLSTTDGMKHVKALVAKPIICPSAEEFSSPSVVSLAAKADPEDHIIRTSNVVMANRTPPNKKPGAKRMGAKAVKSMEKISTEYTLSPEDATNYRALSARANFLAQDRSDVGYSGKELCRAFAVPTSNSYARLKRVARYMVTSFSL